MVDNAIRAIDLFSKLRHGCFRYLRLRRRAVVFVLLVICLVLYVAVRRNWSGISRTNRRLVWKTLKAQCHSCSLVTNSGDLIGSYVGPKIDEADCVIRINNAPTTGYEDDVGRKTAIRIVDGENSGFIIRSLPVHEPEALNMILYYDDNLNKGSKSSMEFNREATALGKHSSTLLYRNDNILRAVEESISQVLPNQFVKQSTERLSVAFVALMFSNEICKHKLNVYGMSTPSYCDKYQEFAYDAPKTYYPPGDKERKCPQSRNFDDILWTSHLDKFETYAAFQLAKFTNKVLFREYTMNSVASKAQSAIKRP